MGLKYIDADDFLEAKLQLSIPEIFNQYGEEYFRQQESVLYNTDFTDLDNCIVSTGGGAPCFHNNMEIMNNSGKTLYLDVSVDELTKRLSKQKENRPIIKDKTEEELSDFIKEHLEIRHDFYKKAQIITSPISLKKEVIDEFAKKWFIA